MASVIVQGGRVPEFQITPDPARLPVAGVSVSDILDAVRRTNLIDSPGLIESDHHLVLALVSGQVHTAEQIGNIVVKTSSAGVPIRITDVATVASSVAPTYTIVTANGKPAVLLNINRQPDSNTLQVANEVHSLIHSFAPALPPGVRLEPFYDQSTIVHDSIASVRDAVFLGIGCRILSSQQFGAFECVSVPWFCVYRMGNQWVCANFVSDECHCLHSTDHCADLCARQTRVLLDVPARAASAGGSHSGAYADSSGRA